MHSKHTKRALLASVLSVVVCCALLVGSTFAWFTDRVTSGRNQIVAGNLDVGLYQVNGTEETPVAADTNLFMEDALWEPGHVEVIHLKVANLGTLALKYQFSVNVVSETPSVNVNGETFRLSDYIKFAVVAEEKTYTADETGRAQAIADAETANPVPISSLSVNEGGVLYPEGKTTDDIPAEEYVTLIVYMPTTVGNVANHRTGEAVPTITLGVNLVATQTPLEYDSFDNQYDTNATYLNTDEDGNILIGTADELIYFAKTVNVDRESYAGKTVKLTADIDLAGRQWTPIGNVAAYPTVTFAGTFDGAKSDTENYTIRNMYAVSTEANVASAGFFGSITGKVQNVNFENATVESTHYAGVVVGYSSANVGMEIANCHVDGATVKTRPERMTDGSYDNGDKAGGILGYCVAGDTVTGCSVKNATISGYRDVGGIVGCAAGNITDNHVENIRIVNDNTNGYNAEEQTTFGAIAGRTLEGYNASGNTEQSVEIVKGAAVGTAGELKSAIGSAEDGDTIVLAEDVTDGGFVSLPAKDLTLDLNGKSLQVTSLSVEVYEAKHILIQNGTVTGGNDFDYGLIDVFGPDQAGTLGVTLQDVVVNVTDDAAWALNFYYCAPTLNNVTANGKINMMESYGVINSGTYTARSGDSHIVNSNFGAEINGGTFTVTGEDQVIFNVSDHNNDFVINDGVFNYAKYAAQTNRQNINRSNIKICGGMFNGVSYQQEMFGQIVVGKS